MQQVWSGEVERAMDKSRRRLSDRSVVIERNNWASFYTGRGAIVASSALCERSFRTHQNDLSTDRSVLQKLVPHGPLSAMTAAPATNRLMNSPGEMGQHRERLDETIRDVFFPVMMLLPCRGFSGNKLTSPAMRRIAAGAPCFDRPFDRRTTFRSHKTVRPAKGAIRAQQLRRQSDRIPHHAAARRPTSSVR